MPIRDFPILLIQTILRPKIPYIPSHLVHDEKDFFRIIVTHLILMGFLDNIVHDFPQINLDVPIRIRLCIKDAALGIVLVNQIEKIIELVVRELLFQLLRQIILDVLDGLFIIDIILQKNRLPFPYLLLLKGLMLLTI